VFLLVEGWSRQLHSYSVAELEAHIAMCLTTGDEPRSTSHRIAWLDSIDGQRYIQVGNILASGRAKRAYWQKTHARDCNQLGSNNEAKLSIKPLSML
jgi:hypothetical protein